MYILILHSLQVSMLASNNRLRTALSRSNDPHVWYLSLKNFNCEQGSAKDFTCETYTGQSLQCDDALAHSKTNP